MGCAKLSRYLDTKKQDYFTISLLASAFAHILLVYFLYKGNLASQMKLPPRVVYSISIESGKSLGGKVQVPDKNDKVVAPPKLAENKKLETEKKEPKLEPKKKEEEVKKTDPKKEVKVDEKKIAAKTPEKKAEPPKKDVNKSYQQALQKYLGESTDAGGKGFGSTGKGGKGLGGGVVKSADWFRYKETLEYHIKKGWNWHDNTRELYTSVAFDIAKDGKVSNIRLAQASGDLKYDDSCLRAVGKANPVPAPKPELYEEFKSVMIEFVPGQI